MKADWRGLLEDTKEIATRKRIRSRPYVEIRVNNGDEKSYKERGYRTEPSKSNHRSTCLIKDKTQDEIFEDQVWLLFASLQFSYINSNNEFRIKYVDGSIEPKQVDVFVADSDCAIIIECKSTNTKNKKQSFKEIISDWAQKMDYMADEVRTHFDNPSMHVAFVLATNNYILSDSDKELAKQYGIVLLNQYDIAYYNYLVKNMIYIAKNHVLGDIFEGKEIVENTIRVPAIRGKYKDTVMYSFMIHPADLLPISYVSRREKNNNSTESSYQRMIIKSRVDSIVKYIKNEGGVFPNSIILNLITDEEIFSTDDSESTISSGILTIPGKYKTAWIIDGQHRLFSYYNLEEARTSFVQVVAFENLSYTKQSELFIDINSKQKKVDKSLLLEIKSDSDWDSSDPTEWIGALISKCVIKLGKEPSSPLYNRIKMSGEDRGGDVTIAALVSALEKTELLGKVVAGNVQYGPLNSSKQPVKDNSLDRAYRILSDYFTIFNMVCESHWKKPKREGYLCTNNGITALILVLKDLFNYLDSKNTRKIAELDPSAILESIREYVEVLADFFRDNDGTKEIDSYRSQLGAKGQKDSSLDMEIVIANAFPDFNSPALNERRESTKEEWAAYVKSTLPELRGLIIENVIGALKKKYGDSESGWWVQGVPENVRGEIGAEKGQDSTVNPYESYFTLNRAKSTIDSNWKLFKPLFGFTENGKKKEEMLRWFNDLLKIENIVNEGKQRITKEDYEQILSIKTRLELKLTGELKFEPESR